MFARDRTLAEVAAEWLKNFEEHESGALADLVNFGLKCAGCDSKVTDHDVEDPDGVTNKLVDFQDEYQASNPTDYPLIAKGKGTAAFKSSVAGFYNVLVKSMAAKGVLTGNITLIENIEIWFSTMSSAANRSFRHTATVICVAIITALCDVARENSEEAAKSTRHAEVERKKARVNRGVVNALNEKVKDFTQTQEFLESTIKDWFDTVFIHRYRDVDPRIRLDCVEGLGDWIVACPDIFFDGSHLRYLGWVLSDSVPATRHEVVRQLVRLYKDKDKLGGLKSFTERFRARIVEIGTQDMDSGVRAAGVELLDILRENGLLEPDDIDAVGRLVFDSEVRVRKAVVGFFSESINDTYNSKVEELGGLETLEEVLPAEDEGNYESPRLEWLKFKALAEMLQSYDSDADLPLRIERGRHSGYLLNAGADSHFYVAAETLYDHVPEVQQWEMLAGFLLFDHSSGGSNGVADDPLSQLKHECSLTEVEEIILLKILEASLKRTLSEYAERSVNKKAKLTKRQKEELHDQQEDAARHLLALIPKLLKKFGETPSTASAVLRLEKVLNQPSLQGLRQDSSTYAAMLDDINKQFLSHSSDDVLAPASKAILHAKSNGDIYDVTEEKVQGLWEDLVNTLEENVGGTSMSVRGIADIENLAITSNALLRIGRLGAVSDCSQALEDEGVKTTLEDAGIEYTGAIEYIIALVQRAIPAENVTLNGEEAALEDEVAARAAEAALVYFMWKIKQITIAVTSDSGILLDSDLEVIAERRDRYEETLVDILRARKATDKISLSVAGNLLDLYNAMYTLRTCKARPGQNDIYVVLAMQIDPAKEMDIIRVFAAAEKSYAKLSGKMLEKDSPEDAIDGDPMDEDPESDDEDEEEDEPTQTQASQQRRDDKVRNALLAENDLCTLTGTIITSVLGGVMQQGHQKRLERNKARLGANFRDLCAYFDITKMEKDAKTKARAKAKGKPATNGTKATKTKPSTKSKEVVLEDEEDEIEDADGEDQEALRRREMFEDEEELDTEEVANGAAEPEAESVLGD